MSEYIERDAAIYALRRRLGPNTSTAQRNMLRIAAIEIRGIKAADVVPVVHGRWERDEWGSHLRRCSVCKKSPVYKDERGNGVAVYAGICINCGTRMDLEV